MIVMNRPMMIDNELMTMRAMITMTVTMMSRSGMLRRLGDLLLRDKEELAQLLTLENGKVVAIMIIMIIMLMMTLIMMMAISGFG